MLALRRFPQPSGPPHPPRHLSSLCPKHSAALQAPRRPCPPTALEPCALRVLLDGGAQGREGGGVSLYVFACLSRSLRRLGLRRSHQAEGRLPPGAGGLPSPFPGPAAPIAPPPGGEGGAGRERRRMRRPGIEEAGGRAARAPLLPLPGRAAGGARTRPARALPPAGDKGLAAEL